MDDRRINASHVSHGFARSELLLEEERLWDRASTQREILRKHFPGMSPGTAAFKESLLRQLEAIPQCHALGRRFLHYMHRYLLVNYYEPENDDAVRLIYFCESHKRGHFCGGIGDRSRGIITAFWLALLSRRRFELYHPAPVPLQKFMPPYLVNYIPSLRKSKTSTHADADRSSLKSFRKSLAGLISSERVEFRLMLLKHHAKYMRWQKKRNRWITRWPLFGGDEWWHPRYVVPDIILYTNSVGIDSFLHMDEELFDVKTRVLGLKRCNISCYYGCLSHILLQPDERLWNEVKQTFRKSKGEALLKSLNSMKAPRPGQVFPFVSLQVRVGGSWAEGLHISEPFRTYPWSLPHYYALVREVVNGVAWRNHPKLFSTHNILWDMMRDNNSVVLFVSSDSSRFVEEASRELADIPSVRVVHTEGDSFQHIDTLEMAGNRLAKSYRFKEFTREHVYFLSLLNHYILSLASHSILSESGFCFTAFWRSRQTASAILIDLTPRMAWQLHLRYSEAIENNANAERSAVSVRNRILTNLNALPTPFYT